MLPLNDTSVKQNNSALLSNHNHANNNWATTYVEGSQTWFPNLLEINIKVSTRMTNDVSLLDSIAHSTFLNSYVDLRGLQGHSLLDHIIVLQSRPQSRRQWTAYTQTLFSRLATDWVPHNNLYLYPIVFIYQYEQHNADDIIQVVAPDLIKAVSQQIHSYWVTRTLITYPVALFDTIISHIEANYLKSSGFVMLITSVPMWCGVIFYFFVLVLLPLWKLLPFTLVRTFNQLYKTSVGLSSSFEFIFFIAASLGLYVLMLLLASDDISEQVSELINTYYLTLFTYLIFSLILLYSVHIFTFLALSAYSKRSLLVVLRQFKNDILDLLSLILRFYILLFRLNVYDLLEDLFDGYYIFLGDFGDEYLLDTSLFAINSFEGFTANNNDENFDFEDTNTSLWFDIFKVYYYVWGQFTYFYVFCLEEGARLLLAVYIIFLIFFEIHATNMRFLERHIGNTGL